MGHGSGFARCLLSRQKKWERHVLQTPLQNLLRRAAARIGMRALAARMDVQESLLEAWMNGQATMPAKKILLLAGIIEELGDEQK